MLMTTVLSSVPIFLANMLYVTAIRTADNLGMVMVANAANIVFGYFYSVFRYS